MNKEVISSYQGINIISLFVTGSSIVLGMGAEAKQDVWIAIILGFILSIPVIYMYSRLLRNYPGKDLFDILQEVFGKFIGKTIALLYIWFPFHLGALVIRNFTEFIQIVSIPETPQFVLALFLGVMCIWAAKEGMEVLGRWSSFVFPIVVFIIMITTIFAIPKMQFMNVKPILYNNLNSVFSAAFGVFSFPFAETVVFTMALSGLKNIKSTFKVYLIGVTLGGTLILIMSTKNLLVLGSNLTSSVYFPAYMAVRIIDISDFIQRIEVLVSVIFIFAGIVKISICLYAASNGFANFFNINNYRKIVVPLGLLMIDFSMSVYSNVMDMNLWAIKVYRYYAFPFQVILPLIILITAEIKIRLNKLKTA